jgi:ferredoxin
MSDGPARGPRATVHHDRCMGVSMCVQAAPRAFRLNPQGQAEFQGPGTATLEELEDAADSCPMSAITVVAGDEDAPG